MRARSKRERERDVNNKDELHEYRYILYLVAISCKC